VKAIVYTEYGPPEVLQLKEVETPTPKDGEVLVKTFASSVYAGDWHALRGSPFYLRLFSGLRRPRNKILGDDVAGRAEAVGRNVQGFQLGDDVFGISNGGAFAEYKCVPEKWLARKPANVPFEEAATVPAAAITALQGLRDKGQIQAGQKVLINGASGGVGTFAVQLAKSFGAEVTGVCSATKSDMVRSIGADHVIDYTKDDFTNSGQRYDLIFAVAGNRSISDYRRALRPEGVYVCAGGSTAQYFQAALLGPLLSIVGKKKVCGMVGIPKQDDLDFLIELVQTGEMKPVIDRRYRLSEVPEALRYFGEGRARGKIVITVEQNDKT
jgi:NADPH:quinone reductase-like Zn-dependent oxidoreductase